MHDSEYRAMFELEDRLWWYIGMRAITLALLDGAVKQRPSVLDIGCGTGYSVAWLREKLKARSAVGIDSSPVAAGLWRERGLDTCAVASANRLPFESAEFDLITCFDVIYQLDGDESHAALDEMRRVLKPGGALFIREPAYDWLRGSHDVAVSTRHRFTLPELKRQLASCGFAVRRATYANVFLFPVAAPYRVISNWLSDSASDVRPVPSLVNRLLAKSLKLEARLIRRMTFPFGLSTIIVARRVE